VTERDASVSPPVEGSLAPFGAPRTDVAALGYVVTEHLLEGTTVGWATDPGAHLPADGAWDSSEHGEAPYRTRILVVRPSDPARFNGTVVVNWQNVSAGVEQAAPAAGEVYEGWAWVGVSAQEVGLYGFPPGLVPRGVRARPALLDHDPERYGTLHHPGDQGSFEIFTQAARAVGRDRRGPVDPLGGLDVRHVLAAGASQSAMRLVAYINGVHHHAPVFDGFLLAVWEGRAPLLSDGAIGTPARHAVRDVDQPVLVVNSEFEATSIVTAGVVDGDRRRIWEVAGTPHAVARRGGDVPDRRGWVANPLSWQPVHEAALAALGRWVADGTPAPAQPRLVFRGDGRSQLDRDEHGNARGGVRLPELEAPTFEYRGIAFGTGRAPLFGAARPLTDDTVRALHPTRADHGRRWDAAVDVLVASGALRATDADAARARAASVALPEDVR
jgi:hypothetical protein